MRTPLYVLCLATALRPVLVAAHNGAVAIAVPVAGIKVDGDFSDWPEDMRRYPILLKEGGVRPKGTEDFQGFFQIGYHAEENAIYVAVEVQDESVVEEAQGEAGPDTQDGCEVYVEARNQEENTPPIQYKIWGNTRGVYGAGRVEDMEVEVLREARVHRYEWRVDLGRVHEGQGHLHPEMVLGFDVILWDKDEDGSISRVAWGRGRVKDLHSDKIGEVVLVEKGGEVGKIQGRMRWKGGEEGVPYGKVRVQSLTSESLWVQAGTDREGNYAVEVPAGKYRVESGLGRGEREVTTIEVAEGDEAEADLSAEASGGVVRPAGSGKTVLAGDGTRKGSWQTLGVSDGLSSLWIRDILQDREGNLWVGTRGNGVSRYDGQQFQTFTTEDGLASNWVRSMVEDREGNLWFGTDNGVSRYDGQQFKTFTTEDGLADNEVEYIVEDRKGNLWFGGEGVSRYDGVHFRIFTSEDGLAGNWVRSMVEDQQGNLWFAQGSGLSRYDGVRFQTFTTEDGLARGAVCFLEVDREGSLWVGTWGGGVCRYDGVRFQTFTTEDGLASNNVASVFEDGEGGLWVGTGDGGVCHYNGREFKTFTTQEGLAHNHVLSILEDWEGNLWFGTFGGGLSRYDRQFQTFTTQDGLAHNGVLSIAEDREGNLWVTNGDWLAGKGVSRYDGHQFKIFTTQDGLAGNQVYAIAEDREGHLWFGTTEGVSRYDGYQFKTFTAQDGLANNWVTSIAEDREGHLWFGTTEGVSRYDGHQFKTFTTQDGLAGNQVYAIAEDREGHLWFGTTEGVSRYDGHRFQTFAVKDGLAGNQVSSVAKDREGNVWVGVGPVFAEGSGRGVCRYDGHTWTTFTTEDGLVSNSVTSILQDLAGHLWFGTNGGGVSRYDGFVFQNLSRQDGLSHDAVNQVLQTHNGDIWIATEGGLTRYHPHPALPPPIHIKDVVADHHYGPVAEIRLPSSQKLLGFEFQGLSFKTRPGQMAYVYKLEGHDPDWRVTRDTRVEYTTLPVGKYSFQVKAVDRDLNYSEQPATVAVEVYYQAITSPVRLAEVQLQDLFASFYKTYNTQPVGTVQVVNDSPDSVAATLSFFLPDYMRRPSEQPLSLAANSSQQVEVKALLDEQVLNLRENVPVQAEVSLSVASGDQRFAAQKKQELTLHGRGALTWDQVGKAAAFITPDDPAVSEFTRSTLVAFEEQVKSLGRPCRNLLRALVLLEALKAHGVRYIPDANSPYDQAAANRSMVDHISYPAEVLQGKAGDCDDLTVLFCSLLENAGVATALVDYPGHIFLLFDSGVSRQEVYKLPVDDKQYVIRGDRVWVPVEVTLVGEGLLRAWQAGAEELVKVRSERERVVDTQAAWEEYAPANVTFAEQVVVPGKEVLQASVDQQYGTLEKQLEEYLTRTYLDPLKVNPGDKALWLELTRVYVALGRYDVAIKSAYSRLVDLGGQDAGLFDQLGIAHYLKGDLEQAAYSFQQAVNLAPEDKRMRGNLDKAMAALGKGVKGKPPAEVTGAEAIEVAEVDDSKAGQVEVDEDSFYWRE